MTETLGSGIGMHVLEKPNPILRGLLLKRLLAHNAAAGPQDAKPEYRELDIILRNAQGKIVGGLVGQTYLGWLEVRTLWVDETIRGKGYGSKLLCRTQKEAVKRGCVIATVATFSLRAKEFYAKHGFKAFGCLDGYPNGQKRHYMSKVLR